MKRRTRYLFIGLGAVFFLVAAPLIIFYVGGIRYNFGNNQYAKTGILSIASDPKKTDITLDGKAAGSAPQNFRFLAPKDYEVKLSQDGYWDWSKRLRVAAGKATIAQDGLDKIYLLKKNSTAQVVSDGVVDYYAGGSRLVYLTSAGVSLVEGNNYGQSRTIALKSGSADHIIPSGGGDYILLSGKQNTQLLNVESWSLVDVTALLAKTTQLQVTDNGLVLGLRQDTLVMADPASKKTTPLLNHVGSFKILGQNLYYTATTDIPGLGGKILAVVPVAAPARPPQVIKDNLPPQLGQSQLLITDQKDVLLYSGKSLYKVNATLDLVSDSVEQLYFDPSSPTLLYSNSSELYWYEFTANKSHLVTRSTQAITSPQISKSIGYAFYIQGSAVKAMELDATDHQNNYSLLELGQGKSLKAAADNKNLYVLDGQKLEILNIR